MVGADDRPGRRPRRPRRRRRPPPRRCRPRRRCPPPPPCRPPARARRRAPGRCRRPPRGRRRPGRRPARVRRRARARRPTRSSAPPWEPTWRRPCRRRGSRTRGRRLPVSRLRARGTAGTAGCGTRRLIDGRVGAGCGVCGCHLGPLATVRSPVSRMVDPRRRCVRCSPRRSPLAGYSILFGSNLPGGRPRRAPSHCNGACHGPSASRPSTLRCCAGRSPARVCGPSPAATRFGDRRVVGWCGERPLDVHRDHVARGLRRRPLRRSRGAAPARRAGGDRGRRAPARPAPAVGAARGPRGGRPVGRRGVDEEHADRRRHGLGHRARGAGPGAAGAAAAGRAGGGGGGRAAAPADGVVTWVVDPIDGTVNFLYGLPWYAVSLAATRDGESLAGASPSRPRAGCGARPAAPGPPATGGRCARSAETDLALTMVGTGFAYSPQRRARQAAFLGGHAAADA